MFLIMVTYLLLVTAIKDNHQKCRTFAEYVHSLHIFKQAHCRCSHYVVILKAMKLSHKLLIILIGFTCLSLLISLVMARMSFESGFNKFIVGQEEKRLEQLSARLVNDFITNGNRWDGIVLNNDANRRPPPSRRMAPPGPPPHRAPLRGVALYPPTAIFDANGSIVSGVVDTSDEHIEVSVVLRYQGETIGTLRSYPPKTPSSNLETTFLTEQRSAFMMIGVVSLAISLLIALLVIPKMLAPFKEVLSTVKNLTARNYDVDIDTQRNDEFGDLMTHIHALAVALKKHEKTQKQWLADISHELRTPLSILKGEIELVQAGARQMNDAQLASFDQEVNRLSRLVDDLYQLSLADIDGLHFDFTSIDFSELVTTALETVAVKSEDKSLTLEATITPAIGVRGDAQRLSQVLLNILLNAIEYTDSPGQIMVLLGADEKTLTLEIHDSAPGVRADHYERLFDPLFREDASRQARTEGAGLGLAICRTIVDAHNGSIIAAPSYLGGLQVKILLPIDKRHLNS